MFETLKRLYNLKLFDKEKIYESAKCDWITKEEYKKITGEEYPEESQAE
ncbi:XkdX family protein [Staphylococcus saprophyticus]